MKNRAYNLMKNWCDTLLEYEITSRSDALNGALLCPACHVIHGRIADLAYPLTTLWAKTGEERYLSAARRLIDWTENNLRRPDGSYRNDAGSTWKGITAFSALAIGDCLYFFGDKLPSETAAQWQTIFVRLSDFCYDFFGKISPNINYFAGAAAGLALAWRITGNRKYLEKANEWERFCRNHFDAQGLFFGEGHPIDFLSDKGCRAIDMGYNLEESLPLLLRHAELTEDAKKLAFYKARLLDHLAFLLPDGAIDNSFGTRHNKWTYWGSRTSDGLLEGLALVLDEPVFAKACERVLGLYERCTHDGLLGLPMVAQAGEPTCLHHAFCHAKALAALVNEPQSPAVYDDTVLLPRERRKGVQAFQNGNLLLASYDGWRATFSCCDALFYKGAENGGGSMTLLWHPVTGPICASTMASYTPSEPLNMQYLRHADSSPCMTPRIVIDGTPSLLDSNVWLTPDDHGVTASNGHWKISYVFDQAELHIRLSSEKPGVFILPVIYPGEAVRVENAVKLSNGLAIRSTCSIRADLTVRQFNQVGGFQYLTLEIPFNDTAEITLLLS